MKMNKKRYEKIKEKYPNLYYDGYNRSGTVQSQDGKSITIFKENEIGCHDKVLGMSIVHSGYLNRPKMMIYAAEDDGIINTYVSNGKKSEKIELEKILEKRGKARAGQLIADVGVSLAGIIAPLVNTSQTTTLAAYGLVTAAFVDAFILGWYRTVEDRNIVCAVDNIENIIKN